MIGTCGAELPSAELCRRNGWGPGTVLVADDPPLGPRRIQVTAVGDALILAREWQAAADEWPGRLGEEEIWDLSYRAWEPCQD